MYVDAKVIGDIIWVSERSKEGVRRVYKDRAPYVLFYEDEAGDYTGMGGERLKRVRCYQKKDFYDECNTHIGRGVRLFENDVPLNCRYIEAKYTTDDIPPLNVTFLDIEVDKDPEYGFSEVSNPFNPITAVTIYHKWLKKAITLAVPPPSLSYDQAKALMDEPDNTDGYGNLDEANGYFLCENESQLLETLLLLLEDTDVITGWNSEFYDLPYIVARIRIALGGEPLSFVSRDAKFEPSAKSLGWLEKLNVFPCAPKAREKDNGYGSEERIYELFGRKHLDYMLLFKKFNPEKLHAYNLDTVLDVVAKQTKIKYDGDIGTFYRKEFRKFLAYNRQDVMGLSAVDDAKKMILLANQMAHMAGVTLDKVTGSVAIIEQAVLKTLHRARDRIAFAKPNKKPDKHVPGAFVYNPDAGLYEWGCSFDINSLYPSLIIALNISPETLIGQIDLTRTMSALDGYVDDILKIPVEERKPDGSHRNHRPAKAIDDAYSEAWHKFTGTLEYHSIIDQTDDAVTLVLEGGASYTMTAKEMSELVREKKWCITGNGTVFDTSGQGIIPFCLANWYKDRADYRKQAQAYKAAGIDAEKAGDKVKQIENEKLAEYYDMVQQAKKLFLNSTYGAYLNHNFRFYDSRCGRSVTLSGRVITKHMCRKAAELLVGEYEFDKRVIIYGDTDSAYVSLKWFMEHNGIELTVDNAVQVADQLGADINGSFPQFMVDNFYTDLEHGAVIQAKRESVFRRGLFKSQKKRYVLYVVDTEGKRKEELKIVGMEVKRTDTPKYVQEFLKKCLVDVVQHGKSQDDIIDFVEDFRAKFRAQPSWKKGSPMSLSNLAVSERVQRDYAASVENDEEVGKKPTTFWTVQAALNTNRLIQMMGEKRWVNIRDGDKVSVLYLKPNQYGMTAVAVKTDEIWAPDWFHALPFDDDRHEEKLITQKLENVFGGLGWSFQPRDTYEDELF